MPNRKAGSLRSPRKARRGTLLAEVALLMQPGDDPGGRIGCHASGRESYRRVFGDLLGAGY